MIYKHSVVIWNEIRGEVTVSKVSIFEGRKAKLEPPFDKKVGWFDLNRLTKNGRADSQGYQIYSKERWKAEGKKVRADYAAKPGSTPFKRQLSENLSRKLGRAFGGGSTDIKERRMLGLPEIGDFSKVDLEERRRATLKQAHPDKGGSSDWFQAAQNAYEKLLSKFL